MREARADARGREAPGEDALLRTLLAYEEEALARRRFDAVPPWSAIAGPEPRLVHALPDGRYLGGLRGAGAVVVLDAAGRELERHEGPPGLTGWAFTAEGTGYAVGEGSARIHGYRLEGGHLRAAGGWSVAASQSLRDVAVGPAGRLYLADRHRSRVLVTSTPGAEPELASESIATCPGAASVRVVGDVLVANCVLAHRIEIVGLGSTGAPDGRAAAIERDGPLWAFDVRTREGGLELASTGVEDHPLDRSDGSFGYIDSFLYVDRIAAAEDRFAVTHAFAIDLSEHGVVTPKAVTWLGRDRIAVAGHGSAAAAIVELDDPPRVQVFPAPAGIAALAGRPDAGLAADPLLDAWIVLTGDRYTAVPADPNAPPRDPELVLGEALAFTTLIAPANEAAGKQSRFTCETCHFEGTVDGRTHFTGRDDVHATTKTLQGLFGNRPHFTRALDATTSVMVDNEFRVAGRGSGLDPRFSLDPREHPWLPEGLGQEPIPAATLRRALLRFVMAFTPEPNPAARDRDAFTPLEREGARRFAEHCESCHEARLRSDDPDSRVPMDAWASHVLGSGALLWAAPRRVMTGVEPYVHAEGARVPSLRRLWTKRPYFTNGSARDLEAVLARVDLGPPFRHDRADQHPLAPRDRAALLAFLDLL